MALKLSNESAQAGERLALENLSKEDLIVRVKQLECHVKQLRNIISKSDPEGSDKASKHRPFDFTKFNTRHVALKIVYLGWGYQGFAVQEDTDKTIEAALFKALLHTRLIESRETSCYHRCGRTDKGVSAFGQVISIDLRSNLLDGVGVKQRPGGTAHERPGDKTKEINYVHILNKVLPPEIRVLAWSPVEPEFSARFSCKSRTYKYFFPLAGLNLKAMREATSHLIGEHDFRNLCKMDVGNGVVTFTRRIDDVIITLIDETQPISGYSLCELTVVGQAFLWHQIRCIVAVLLLVGEGKEQPEIIGQLLDVETNPQKPQYTMASELPLVLFDCQFEGINWIFEADWHRDNIRHIQKLWAEYSVRSTMTKRMLDELNTTLVTSTQIHNCQLPPSNTSSSNTHSSGESEILQVPSVCSWNECGTPVLQQADLLLPGNKPRVYRPLLERPKCESLEDRIDHYAKRRKIADIAEDK